MPVIIALFLSAALTHSGFAQNVTHMPQWADSTAPAIMAHWRAGAARAPVGEILRQVKGPESDAKLGELADSMTARAIRAPSALGNEPSEEALAAVLELGHAGSVAHSDGIPYKGSLERLMRIHQQATPRNIRVAALAMMMRGPDRPRVLRYLMEAAESSDHTPYGAVQFLITDANGGSWGGQSPTAEQRRESTRVVYELYDRGRVTNRLARDLLDGWVHYTRPVKP